MRFHVVSVPFTNTTDQFSACAFTEKVRKFCIMMHDILGHEVFLYAGDKNEAPCTEHISIMPEQERLDFLGPKHYTQGDYNYTLPFWRRFSGRAVGEISKRIQPRDFICIISGLANKQICDHFPANMAVEFGIGYPGSYSPYRVFESYAWMHATYAQQAGNHDTDGHFFHDVIPSYFEADRFPFSEEKDDYLMFIGRLTKRKGVQIAEEVAQATGKRLVVCGTGDLPVQDWWDYKGVVEWEERGRLMSRAQAVLVPTLYLEPFGSVAVEAQMCGTPAITTDWGAFPETVDQWLSGFRCRTLQEFIDAVHNAPYLDKHAIRKRALRLYSLEAVAQRYETYFERLMTLWGGGFYQRRKPWDTSSIKTPTSEETSGTVIPLATPRKSGTI